MVNDRLKNENKLKNDFNERLTIEINDVN